MYKPQSLIGVIVSPRQMCVGVCGYSGVIVTCRQTVFLRVSNVQPNGNVIYHLDGDNRSHSFLMQMEWQTLGQYDLFKK